MKEVNTQSFRLLNWEHMKVIIFQYGLLLVFNKKIRQDSQNLNNDTFYEPPVTDAQSGISTGKYPNSAILLNYNDDDYSQGYGQIEENFRALTKDYMLKPYISEHDFRSTNNSDDNGYNLYVCDIRYQKILENAQKIKVEFSFSEIFRAGRNG